MVSSCKGACDQGRLTCPHPELCQEDVWEELERQQEFILNLIILCAAGAIIVGLWGLVCL